MAASLRQRLIKAFANKKAGDAIADSIEAAAAISPIGSTTALPSDSLANLAAGAETRLDQLESRFNALLAANQAAAKAL